MLKPSSRFEITSDLPGWKDLTAELTGRALDYRGDVMLGQGTFRHDPLSRLGGEAAAKAFSRLLLILLLRRLSLADLIGGSQLKKGLEPVEDWLLHCTTFPMTSRGRVFFSVVPVSLLGHLDSSGFLSSRGSSSSIGSDGDAVDKGGEGGGHFIVTARVGNLSGASSGGR